MQKAFLHASLFVTCSSLQPFKQSQEQRIDNDISSKPALQTGVPLATSLCAWLEDEADVARDCQKMSLIRRGLKSPPGVEA